MRAGVIGRPRLGQFLGTAGRLYLDVGSHPEYATPEDTSAEATTANQIAGEEIVQDTFEQGTARRHEDGSLRRDVELVVNKRLVGNDGITWGAHENYGVMRHKLSPDANRLALLGFHMSTRNVYCGAGWLRPDGKYWVAQKPAGLNCDTAKNTTGSSKPVINLRDEQEASYAYCRIHVTSGDANMSPWQIRMAIGTTALVIALEEYGDHDPLTLDDKLLTTIRSVASDPTLEERYHIRVGRTPKVVSVIDAQREQLKLIKRYAKQISIDDEASWTIEQWDKALADLEQDPMLLADRVDWVAKLLMIRRLQEKTGYDLSHPKLRGIDILWGELSKNGIGLKLRQQEWAQWMPSDIKERKEAPPQTTRAKMRGAFVLAYGSNEKLQPDNTNAKVDWKTCTYNTRTIKIDVPSQTQSDAIDALIACAPPLELVT